jgi:uncharacterized protein YcfJ
MRKLIVAVTLAALASPAVADPPPWAPAHGRRAKEPVVYDSQRRYIEPVAITRADQVWRGADGQYRCRRGDGTTGLVIGAAAGALVGRELDGGRDRTTGTILGAAGGALLGREIDRGGLRCR